MTKDLTRADARLNRERILAAAQAALEITEDASVNAILKAAGVGPGTFYRHFPTREALLLEVHRQHIEALLALGPELLTRRTPLEALRDWCDQVAEFACTKHHLVDALGASVPKSDHSGSHQIILETLKILLDAGKKSGEVEKSLDPADVLPLLLSVWRIAPDEKARGRSKRMMDLLFRGIRS